MTPQHLHTIHLWPFCCHLHKYNFVFVSCGRQWSQQWWVCSAFRCAQEVNYVVGSCNVVATLSMAESVLPVRGNCRVHEQCWICMVCWSLSYIVKFYCCFASIIATCKQGQLQKTTSFTASQSMKTVTMHFFIHLRRNRYKL